MLVGDTPTPPGAFNAPRFEISPTIEPVSAASTGVR